MSGISSQEDACEELKHEFLGEFKRMQSVLHRLINHLTAISGYAQLVQLVQSETEVSATEMHKIVHTVEESTLMLRACIASMKDFEQRYS